MYCSRHLPTWISVFPEFCLPSGLALNSALCGRSSATLMMCPAYLLLFTTPMTFGLLNSLSSPNSYHTVYYFWAIFCAENLPQRVIGSLPFLSVPMSHCRMPYSRTSKQPTNNNIGSHIVFFKKPKFEDRIMKKGKYDSKAKSVQFFFLFYLKKFHHFGGPKHNVISALPGLDRKKLFSTYWHIVILKLPNLKFQLDKFNNNKEKYKINNFSIRFKVSTAQHDNKI
jgi:hypothetical protein